MQRGETIADPARYWTYLRDSIAAGPGVARAYYGALQNELRLLHELVGPQPVPSEADLDAERLPPTVPDPAMLDDEFGPA